MDWPGRGRTQRVASPQHDGAGGRRAPASGHPSGRCQICHSSKRTTTCRAHPRGGGSALIERNRFGFGLHPVQGHHELNLWLGCPANSKTAKRLRELTRAGMPIDLDDERWDPVADEDEPTVPVLPLGFESLTLNARSPGCWPASWSRSHCPGSHRLAACPRDHTSRPWRLRRSDRSVRPAGSPARRTAHSLRTMLDHERSGSSDRPVDGPARCGVDAQVTSSTPRNRSRSTRLINVPPLS